MRHRHALLAPLLILLNACVGTPDGISPIQNFDSDAYLGKWYEIARLDHRFERDMHYVTADYSLRDDGSIAVLNQGYKIDKNKWGSAEGKAKFAKDETVGHLKVSFFGPFYGSYVVFFWENENAYVTGNNRDYLWWLSRAPNPSAKQKAHFLEKASELSFTTEKLIWVKHENPPAKP